MILAVLVFKELEPVGCHLCKVSQVAVNLINLSLQTCHQFVGLVLIELQDALHLYLQQLQYVVLCHLANHLRIVRGESLVDMLTNSINVRCLFEFLVFIDTLLDEDALQTLEVQLLQQFALTYLKFLTNQVLGAVD